MSKRPGQARHWLKGNCRPAPALQLALQPAPQLVLLHRLVLALLLVLHSHAEQAGHQQNLQKRVAEIKSNVFVTSAKGPLL